jgi:hypothetical protein
MARSLRYANEPAVDFYYCVEGAEEAHFLNEFREVAARRGDFRVFLVSRDEVGFLTAAHLAKESGELATREILICGPPAMIESLRLQLTAHGVPVDRIHAEEFGFAKLGASGRSGAREEPGRPVPPPLRRWPAVLVSVALVLAVGVIIGNHTISRDGGDSAGAAATSDVSAGKAVFASAGVWRLSHPRCRRLDGQRRARPG